MPSTLSLVLHTVRVVRIARDDDAWRLRCSGRDLANLMSPEPADIERELRSLHSEVDALKRDMGDREHVQESLLARLRLEAAMREGDLAVLRQRLDVAEHELDDLRAIRDALTPPQLPK